MRWRVAVLWSVAVSAAAHSAGAGLEVRFFPAKRVFAYELEARRGVSSVVLQNVAIVNATPEPVAVGSAEIDVLVGERAAVTQRLLAADLDRAAKNGAATARAGLLDLYAFQFRPDVLLKGATLAASARLDPGQALLVGPRVLAFQGAADAVRVRVAARAASGAEIATSGVLPVAVASANGYAFPLRGRWFVGAGATLHSHHRWAVPEEFALDLVRLGANGATHSGDGATRTDYYAYGREVVAAADGVVESARDDLPESDEPLRRPGEGDEAYSRRVVAAQEAILAKGGAALAAGNVVVIGHAGGEHSSYAHLKPGSVRVRKGDNVKLGQPIGLVGFSGNATEPHLHFEVSDGPDPLMSVGIPPRFVRVSLPFADWTRAVQTGDVVEAR